MIRDQKRKENKLKLRLARQLMSDDLKRFGKLIKHCWLVDDFGSHLPITVHYKS